MINQEVIITGTHVETTIVYKVPYSNNQERNAAVDGAFDIIGMMPQEDDDFHDTDSKKEA